MLIEKWYLDVQSQDTIGYYYVGRIKIGGISIAFSEIHHQSSEIWLSEQKMSTSFSRRLRSISSKYYEIRFSLGQVDLDIKYDSGLLTGRWYPGESSLSLPYRPLFQNDSGSCRWKIWSPRSKVELKCSGDHPFEITGFGYIDFVRLTIPTWNIPFKRLHWGRMFSGSSWICLLAIEAPGYELGVFVDSKDDLKNVQVQIIKTPSDKIDSFIWQVGGRRIECHVAKQLQAGPILDAKRIAWLQRNRDACYRVPAS